MTSQVQLSSGLITVPPVLAGGRFGGFRPDNEGPQQVRPSIISDLNELQKLRQLREMLRSMPPEAVLTHIEFYRNLTLFEAVALAKSEGKLIVPNDVVDGILTKTKYPLPTARNGTLVIHEAPDQPFGEHIIQDGFSLDSVTFTVPTQFRGKTNCVLIVEHPDFDLHQLGDHTYQFVVPDESKLILAERFRKNMAANPEQDFTTVTKYLWKGSKSYIGLLVRRVDWGRGIGSTYGPVSTFDVALASLP